MGPHSKRVVSAYQCSFALGDFKGESVGIGPSLLWQPKRFDGRLSIIASWLHDLDATRRQEADYAVLTIAFDL